MNTKPQENWTNHQQNNNTNRKPQSLTYNKTILHQQYEKIYWKKHNNQTNIDNKISNKNKETKKETKQQNFRQNK